VTQAKASFGPSKHRHLNVFVPQESFLVSKIMNYVG